ncbi:hypothetical protein KGY71_04190 [Candidatus Bipolaricaulota bacterium]|nr:hypothetical protein [Candidatus Bipolaricaulota bacterium]
MGWTINAQQSLSISSNNTLNSSSSDEKAESVYQIPEPTEGDFERGHRIEKSAVELVASSNVGWEIKVEADSSYMGAVEDYQKPVTDLSIRGDGDFKQLGTTLTTIASGQPGEHKIGVDYKIQYDEDEYEEGDYEVDLEYTITVA